MIDQILPPEVAATEAFSDPPDVSLFPEEEEAIARAVDKRRREFSTARACARESLARLGIPPVPIIRGPGGAPRWPDGVIGSITHCSGYRACAVARTRDVTSIGIDAEPNGATPDGVLRTVSDQAERTHLATLAADEPGIHWDRLLFSAKESVYKTWFPLTGRWLGFGDASISIDRETGTFTARLLVPGPVVNGSQRDSFEGRWIVRDGLIVTAITISGGDHEPPG
ncbi:MAG: 4'-phosphopantetheinyl transferase superfamily protein [Nocardiopsaceae bacterium]|nr:4'-phosphopantetheinyl transferase superfamily protein [Nocardiopsaceae bacterium]